MRDSCKVTQSRGAEGSPAGPKGRVGWRTPPLAATGTPCRPRPPARPREHSVNQSRFTRMSGRKVLFNRLKLFESIERKRDDAFVRNLSPNVQALRGADDCAPGGDAVVLPQVCQQEEGQEAQEEKAPRALTPPCPSAPRAAAREAQARRPGGRRPRGPCPGRRAWPSTAAFRYQ